MPTFQVATPADSDEVASVLSAAYGTRMANAYAPDALRDIVPIISEAQDALLASGTFFIARDAHGRAVAVGGWTDYAPGTREVTAGLAHVRHVAADPAYRGEGHGRALVRHLMNHARAAGFTRMEALSTRNAEAFYASLGFVRIGAVDVLLPGDIVLPSVRMEAPLAPSAEP